MGYSLSQMLIDRKKKEIAKRGEASVQKATDIPAWKQFGKMALSMAPMIAMPWLSGALLSGLGTAGAAGSGLFSFLSKAPQAVQSIAKFIGTGLQAGKKGQGIGAMLKGLLTKTGTSTLIDKAGKSILDIGGPKASDITVGDDPLSQLLGGGAEKQLQQDFLSAKKDEKTSSIMQNFISSLTSQAGGMDEILPYLRGVGGQGWGSSAEEIARLSNIGGYSPVGLTPHAGQPNVASGTIFDPKPNSILAGLGGGPTSPISSGISTVNPIDITSRTIPSTVHQKMQSLNPYPNTASQILGSNTRPHVRHDFPNVADPGLYNVQGGKSNILQQFIENFMSGKTYSPK